MAKEKFKLSKENAKIVKKLWHFAIKRYFKYVLYAVFFMVLSAAAEAYTYSFLKDIFDEGFLKQNYQMLNIIALKVIVLFIIKNITLFAHTYIMGIAGMKITLETQIKMFSHFMKMDLKFFQNKSTGQLLTNYGADTGAVNSVLQTFFTDFLKDLITIAAMLILMIYQSWTMSVVIFFVLPAVAIPLKVFGGRVRKIFGKSVVQGEIITSYLSELFRSIQIVKIYNKENHEKKKIREVIDYCYDLGMKNLRITSINRPVLEMIGGVAIAGSIIFGGWQISKGLITTGQFATFLTALFACYRPLKSVSKTVVEMQTSMKRAERMFDVFDSKPGIVDIKDAKELKYKKGEIEFKNVIFSYSETDGVVLNDISFKIKPGQSVALVGPSGGGKSTILKLIPRFYDIDSGAILIDGQDIKKITQHSLRDHLGLVSQDIILFDDTIKANIAYGLNRKCSDTEIIKAATLANAHEFIEKLPHGYLTKIGEAGTRLSGGQKQRLSIARAILKNAPILLLDEATSALDTESEKLVQNSIDNLVKGRTTITIAHRLSTIINADVIFVIAKGEILESGSHEELLKKKGSYFNLYQLQFKKQEKKKVKKIVKK